MSVTRDWTSLRFAKNLARSAGTSVADFVDRQANVDTLRVAITGLSRAGKTVFITSLVHNLLATGRGYETLPALSEHLRCLSSGGLRLTDAEILSPSVEDIPLFPYRNHLEAMAAEQPSWPPRTNDLTTLRLQLTLRRSNQMASHVLGQRRVILEIVDYPGEWLLDWPLLDQNYLTWSRSMFDAMQSGARAECFRPFLSRVAALDADGPASNEAAFALHHLYKQCLQSCQSRYHLRYLQPGRFLRPGPWGDPPLLWFAPMLSRVADEAAPGSLGELMARRFEAYKTDMRNKVFSPFFSRFDRQIVLVDVLSALHAGREVFEDTREALRQIASCYRLGSGGLAGRMLNSHISHVVFAATRADHVPEIKRDALRLLLLDMIGETAERIRSSQVTTKALALASIRCSQDDVAVIDGREVQVVRAVPLGEERPKKFWPGEVPAKVPSESFWSGAYFEMPTFKPPVINSSGQVGIAHIGLDEAVVSLFGDRL